MDMAHGRDWKQQAHDAGVVSTGERAGGRFNLAREHRTLSWYTLQRSVADWTIPVFGWPLSFFFSLNIFSALYLIYYTRLDEVCVCCVRSFFLHSSFGPLARSFVHSTGPCTHTHTHAYYPHHQRSSQQQQQQQESRSNVDLWSWVAIYRLFSSRAHRSVVSPWCRCRRDRRNRRYERHDRRTCSV